jgi:hypothetical protein
MLSGGLFANAGDPSAHNGIMPIVAGIAKGFMTSSVGNALTNCAVEDYSNLSNPNYHYCPFGGH